MVLLLQSKDTTTLVNELMPMFKDHLRILHLLEDELISLYLSGAIDAISIYGDNDIYHSTYDVFYPENDVEQPSADRMYLGKVNTYAVIIKDSTGVDISNNYTVDAVSGTVFPSPYGLDIYFESGYLSKDDMPTNLVNIIFRYAAHLYENRESVRIGEPKMLPDWVQYAMSSIWTPRV